jgi:hypothetical protein
VSHQGEKQNARDIQLIREYPGIFPNFYLLPTPHLDRAMLLELREFSLMGVERFRWLLVALDQIGGGLLGVFCRWREWRLCLWPALDGFAIRRYYRSKTFIMDFLDFVRQHPEGHHPVIKAFVEYENAMRVVQLPDAPAASAGVELSPGAAIWWTDIPVRNRKSRVIELTYDVQRIIDALKLRTEPEFAPGPHFYVTREAPSESESLETISDWVACLLRACDGSRSVEQVVKRLSGEIQDVDEDVREYAILRLLEGVHADGLIEIRREIA